MGLSRVAQDDLILILRALVANPTPKEATSISNEIPRFRLEVSDMTIGYEVDKVQDVVVVKVILLDASRDSDDVHALELIKSLMSG